MKRKARHMDNEKPNNDVDVIDVIFILGGIAAIASAATLVTAIPAGIVYLIQHFGRRLLATAAWANEWTKALPEPIKQQLLPAPKTSDELVIRQTEPLLVRNVDPYEGMSWWNRVLMPIAGEEYEVMTATTTAPTKGKNNIEKAQLAFLQKALKTLPKYYNYTQLPKPPTKLSVPIGVDSETKQVLWGDFSSNGGNIIHALVAGQTGAGKDALLRLWFTSLTNTNKPSELQFVILDGKIDWLSPALINSPYMAIAPAGGIEIKRVNGKYKDFAQERMATNLAWLFDEIENRSDKMQTVGAVDLASYYRKTGIKLPYIFLIASDVGEQFGEDLEMLIKLLIMKGRAFGIRMIISMQNPVGENTKWRSQIGMVVTGYQQMSDHDRYILGIPVDRMYVRPSQLPNPEESDYGKGLFVVRLGSQQHLVRTPHLPEDVWDSYLDNVIIREEKVKVENTSLLDTLLQTPVKSTGKTDPIRIVAPALKPGDVLSADQIKNIFLWYKQGYRKSMIMEMLGYTNGDVWKTKGPYVEKVIAMARKHYD